ncbi:hypothetical protein FRC19_008271, partial [Serendipita sp. 401]
FWEVENFLEDNESQISQFYTPTRVFRLQLWLKISARRHLHPTMMVPSDHHKRRNNDEEYNDFLVRIGSQITPDRVGYSIQVEYEMGKGGWRNRREQLKCGEDVGSS